MICVKLFLIFIVKRDVAKTVVRQRVYIEIILFIQGLGEEFEARVHYP